MTFSLRLAAALMLLFVGVLKLASGYDPRFTHSQVVYWTAAGLEVLLAGGLLTNAWWRWCGSATVVLAAVGLVAAHVEAPLAGSCGCFGQLGASAGMRTIFVAVVGLLASLALCGEKRAGGRENSPSAVST